MYVYTGVTLCILKIDVDIEKGDDLSAYSDDLYENEVADNPPPRPVALRVTDPNRLIFFLPYNEIEPHIPIMKGQYEIAEGVCTWIGIVLFWMVFIML